MKVNNTQAAATKHQPVKKPEPAQGKDASTATGATKNPAQPQAQSAKPVAQGQDAAKAPSTPAPVNHKEASQFLNNMDHKLLDQDYQKLLHGRFNQAFDPKKSTHENIQSVSNAIGKPIRYTHVDSSGNYTTKEFGGSMNDKHKPDRQAVEGALQNPKLMALAQNFSDTGENNVIDMVDYKGPKNKENHPEQDILGQPILGHELFHLMQAKSNGGYNGADFHSTADREGGKIINEDLNAAPQEAKGDLSRMQEKMDAILGRVNDSQALESAFNRAKTEYQAHNLDTELSRQARAESPVQARNTYNESYGSKLFYGAAASEIEQRLQELKSAQGKTQ